MLKVLICERWSAGPTGIAVGIEAAIVDHQPGPGRRVLRVERIRRLEPGTREAQDSGEWNRAVES